MTKDPRKASGFTLITTLFVVVVVSSLAAYLVNISVSQHFSSALTLSALRSRHAALSGLEWVAYRVANVANSCPTIPTSMTVEGYNVTIAACSASDITEGATAYRMFDVTVNAERGVFGDADYVNLSVRAQLRG